VCCRNKSVRRRRCAGGSRVSKTPDVFTSIAILILSLSFRPSDLMTEDGVCRLCCTTVGATRRSPDAPADWRVTVGAQTQSRTVPKTPEGRVTHCQEHSCDSRRVHKARPRAFNPRPKRAAVTPQCSRSPGDVGIAENGATIRDCCIHPEAKVALKWNKRGRHRRGIT